MVYLIPFYKDPNFKIEEAQEVRDFRKKKYSYHEYLQCLKESFEWHNKGNFMLSTDIHTHLNFDIEKYIQDTTDKTIIESKVINETRLICDDNGIDENIIMCGVAHIVNGDLSKIFEDDFDIMIPIRKRSKINNAIIAVKKVTDDVRKFFEHRFELFYKMNEIWYGDQKTYDKIIRKALDLPTKKFAIELGTYTIKNCKIKLVEYGGHYCGCNVRSQPFDDKTLLYDFKGDRKTDYIKTFQRERTKYGKNL